MSTTKYRDSKQTLTSWMTSLMKGAYETRQEYKFSLYVITKYLKLSPIIGKYGKIFCMSVLMFICKHIIQQEEWYAFYNCTNIHHNEEYSNAPLEGTNNTIKHSSSSTHPQMSMGNAMRIICEQSTQKTAIKRDSHHINMEKSSTNYETKPVHDRVTMFASSKIWGLFRASKNFKCLRISYNTWKVCRYSTAMNVSCDRHIPKFNRIRTVKFHDGRLHCNCPLTHVLGYSLCS